MSFFLNLLKDFSKEQILQFLKDNWGIIAGYMFCGYLISQWIGLIGSVVCFYIILQRISVKNSTDMRGLIDNQNVNLKKLDAFSDDLKKMFDEQNDIEDKLLIICEPLTPLQIDPIHYANKLSLTCMVSIHNCSKQIINFEIDSDETEFKVNTVTKMVGYKFEKPMGLIRPFSHVDFKMYDVEIDLSDPGKVKELSIILNICLKYGVYKKPLNHRLIDIKKWAYQSSENGNLLKFDLITTHSS